MLLFVFQLARRLIRASSPATGRAWLGPRHRLSAHPTVRTVWARRFVGASAGARLVMS